MPQLSDGRNDFQQPHREPRGVAEQWHKGCADAVSRYLTRLGHRAPATSLRARTEHAIGLVPPPAEPTAVDDAHARVLLVARDAAIDALAATERTLDARLRHAAPRRLRCRHVPMLLRQRADSAISPADLERLYKHLDHCSGCAHVARRFEAAEWHLYEALGAVSSAAAGTQQQPVPVPAPVRRDAPDPFADAPASWTPRHGPPPVAAPVEPSPAPRHHAEHAGARSDRLPTRQLRNRSARALAGWALALLLATGAIALVASGRLGGGAPRHPTANAAAPSAAAGAPVPTAATAARGVRSQAHAPRVPFTLAGLRLNVFAAPHEDWPRFADSLTAGPGLRWELVTVRATNLNHAGFDPRMLHYRLADRNGTIYFPDLKKGTGAAVGRPARPLAPGQQGQVELAFRVPTSASALDLLFNPTTKNIRLQVPLDQ